MFSRVLIPCFWISFSIFYSMRSRVFVKETEICPVLGSRDTSTRAPTYSLEIYSKDRNLPSDLPVCGNAKQGWPGPWNTDRGQRRPSYFKPEELGRFRCSDDGVQTLSRVCFNIHGAKVEENSRPNGSHRGTSGRICLLLPFINARPRTNVIWTFPSCVFPSCLLR